MNWSIPLLRVRGIQIKVHLTFALILVWAAWYWGIISDDGGRGALFGIVATLLLFVCVTLHELGHAFAALRYGIEVQDITLLPIGGVARLRVPDNARQELVIAAAGPAVNVIIAVVLLMLGAVTGTGFLGDPGSVYDDLRAAEWGALLPYLTTANIWLVLFNVIPAFPMDGGRILRALLALWMDYSRATAIAAAVGQGLAFLFGIAGFFTGNFFLILIAIFVWFGASQEGAGVVLRQVLGGTTVGQVMIRQPRVLSATDPLGQAAELTLTTSQADFPVVDGDGRVVGLLTMGDLLRGLRDDPAATVGEAMQREYPVAAPGESVAAAQGRLGEAGTRAMAIIQPDGRLAGLLTIADVSETLQLLSAHPELARRGSGRPQGIEQGPF